MTPPMLRAARTRGRRRSSTTTNRGGDGRWLAFETRSVSKSARAAAAAQQLVGGAKSGARVERVDETVREVDSHVASRSPGASLGVVLCLLGVVQRAPHLAELLADLAERDARVLLLDLLAVLLGELHEARQLLAAALLALRLAALRCLCASGRELGRSQLCAPGGAKRPVRGAPSARGDAAGVHAPPHPRCARRTRSRSHARRAKAAARTLAMASLLCRLWVCAVGCTGACAGPQRGPLQPGLLASAAVIFKRRRPALAAEWLAQCRTRFSGLRGCTRRTDPDVSGLSNGIPDFCRTFC